MTPRQREEYSEFLQDLRSFLNNPLATEESGFTTIYRRMCREILADIRNGIVPETVRSFSELHNYVDANAYGGFFDWQGELNNDYTHRFMNRLQNRVHDWIADGRFLAELRKNG
jgi:hypothetical protein